MGDVTAGGAFELEWWRASKVENGLVVRLEQFPLDQRAEAEACFERLTAPRNDLAENAAIRSTERWVAAMVAADATALRELCAPEVVLEDRRPITGATITGPEAAVTNWMLAAQAIGLDLRWRPLATRGEGLVLAVLTYLGRDIELDLLSLTETAEDGLRLVRAVGWAIDDEDAAYAELDARTIYLAGEGAEQIRTLSEAVAQLNALRVRRIWLRSWRDADRSHNRGLGLVDDCAVSRFRPGDRGGFRKLHWSRARDSTSRSERDDVPAPRRRST